MDKELQEAMELLEEIHTTLLLHEDAGRVAMDFGTFWPTYFKLEHKVSKKLEDYYNEEAPVRDITKKQGIQEQRSG